MLQKRIFCTLWLIILIFGASLSAQAAPSAYIFFQPISGNGGTPDEKANITKMLLNEIAKQNCVLLDTPYGTEFILFGSIAPHYEGYEDLYLKNLSPAETTYSYNVLLEDSPNAYATWQPQLYAFHLILRNTQTNENLLLQSLIYATMDDIYNFFPLIMFNLFSKIMGTDPTIRVAGSGDFGESDTGTWRDKWLYLRLSADWPITFYLLRPTDDLHAGTGIYYGKPGDPDFRVSPQDNKSVALPGGTFGIEFQFFNWMSIEPKVQVGWEYLSDQNFVNLSAGVDLKGVLKFSNIMLEPYGSIIFPVGQYFMPEFPEIFNSYPLFGYGGGIQLGIKAGPIGVLFVDVNYMYYGDVGVYNPHGDLYPNPPIIHYTRTAIGLGVGMKIGFIDRKKKEPKEEKSENEEK